MGKKHKTRHDWVGVVIYWELCKKLKYDHSTKWYMHKPESVLENETHKILLDFEIQTDHIIPARRSDLVIVKKKKEFGVSADHEMKIKENEKKDKYLDLARELKTTQHENEGDTNCDWRV